MLTSSSRRQTRPNLVLSSLNRRLRRLNFVLPSPRRLSRPNFENRNQNTLQPSELLVCVIIPRPPLPLFTYCLHLAATPWRTAAVLITKNPRPTTDPPGDPRTGLSWGSCSWTRPLSMRSSGHLLQVTWRSRSWSMLSVWTRQSPHRWSRRLRTWFSATQGQNIVCFFSVYFV